MFNIYYLINNSEEVCNIVNILMQVLSGETVDRIRKSKGNTNKKERREERRSYERERIFDIFKKIFISIRNMMEYTFKYKGGIHIGSKRNKDNFKGKEKEIEEIINCFSDIIEEEDMSECLICYLYLLNEKDYRGADKEECSFSHLSLCSNDALCYLLFLNKLKVEKMYHSK